MIILQLILFCLLFTTNPCRKARVFRHGMNGAFSFSDYFLYWFCMYCITVSLLILPSVLLTIK